MQGVDLRALYVDEEYEECQWVTDDKEAPVCPCMHLCGECRECVVM